MNIVPSLASRCLAAAALLALVASCDSGAANAAEGNDSPEDTASLVRGRPKPGILLVHGSSVDALSWQKVTALLQQRGYTVVAVEIPLTGLANDVATAKRAIAALAATKGPLVVVGHSFGGMVITGAAVDTPPVDPPRVKALVYINAFAPDPGVPAGFLLQTAPRVKLADALLPPDSAGFVFVDPAKFRDALCADVPVADCNVAAASQKPILGSAFLDTLEVAAWQTLPSWYLVGRQDEAIHPDLQRSMAKHIGARTVEIDSSHVSFISHPHAVVHLIEQAARSAGGAR